MVNKISFAILFVIISLLICFLQIPYQVGIFDENLNLLLTIIGFINILVFCSVSVKINNSWISYDTLFLLGYAIVHFQIPFLASIGIEPEKPNFIWINKLVVNYATWLSLLAMLLWMLGSLLFTLRSKIKGNYQKDLKIQEQTEIFVTRKLDIFLLILFILFISFVGSDFLGGKYNGGDNWGAGANYIFLLLRTTLYLKSIYLFIENQHRMRKMSDIIRIFKENLIFSIILLSYLTIFLSAGDRGPILSLSILFGISYSIFVKKISGAYFIIFIIVGSALFMILKSGRTREDVIGNKNIITRGFNELQGQDQTLNLTEELANSNRILYRALDVVPDKHPYLYGATFGMEVVGIIPFGGSTFLEVTNLPDMYKSSAFFFTVWGQGIFYTSGEGSEILADIYINWGVYGVFVLMFLLGYFVSYCSYRAIYNKNLTFIIIYILLTISALYINRSHYLEPLKTIVYVLVLKKLLITKSKRS